MKDIRHRIMWWAFLDIKAYLPEFAIIFVSFPTYVFIMFFLWQIVYASAATHAMPFQTLITYFILAYVVSFCTTQRWSVASELDEDVRHGRLVPYLVRPFDYRHFLFFHSLGRTLFFAAVFTGFVFVAGLLTPLAITADAFGWLLFFALVSLGWLFNYFFYLTIGCFAFWTESTHGMLYAVETVQDLVSGFLIPLQFLPAAIGSAVYALPFQYALYTPISLLIGTATTTQALQGLGILAAWTAATALLANFIWKKGLARFTGYGV